jgi:nitroreductase
MLKFDQPIFTLIRQRFSCRHYRREPIDAIKLEQLQTFIDALPPGPFGSRPRFELAAATEDDSRALRGLGTYGFIRHPAGFIMGAIRPSEYDLEDFGYLMEAIILYATQLDLGTCWLGGTFTKSRFARKMDLAPDETIPAVTSMGEFTSAGQRRKGIASQTAGSDRRLPWDKLFSDSMLGNPLTRNQPNGYAASLEMVRLGPSASNRQPWRITKHASHWRFYLQRSPGYRRDPIKIILDLCDLQRLDMGIAMCHFQLAAEEMGLKGKWIVETDLDTRPDDLTEYIVSWECLE